MLPKTKIVCTLGPSSWNPETISKLIENGMTVARINGAFATLDDMKAIGDMIRSISPEVALMIDIKGHEVRLNKFERDVPIQPGDTVVFGNDNSEYIYIDTYPDLYKSLKSGDTILVNDGNVTLTVEKIENQKIYCKVIIGKLIPKGKGLNIPGVFLDNPPVTEKDKAQIEVAVREKWDFIAASFIRSREDVEAVKELLVGSHTKVISKIEDGFGVDNIDDIIDASEGIMVARGDMGVEIPYYRVPHIQKTIVHKCNSAIKPVIVATQMLESMIENSRPTRAEVTDVANAVMEGADAVMLSGETANGKNPIDCVRVMKDVALETEQYIYENFELEEHAHEIMCEIRDDGTHLAIAIAESVADLSYKMPEAKVIVDTRTGFSAKLISSFRLKNNIIAVTPFDYYARRLSLYKGVKTCLNAEGAKLYEDSLSLQKSLIEQVKNKGLISTGDTAILVTTSSYNLDSSSAAYEKASIKVISI